MVQTLKRRDLIRWSAALGIAGAAGTVARAQATTDAPIVTTTHGQLRGMAAANSAHAFKGIRYGAPTGGANRFLPPQPVEPWTGVRDAFAYGMTAPQARDFPPSRASTRESDVPEVGEDCLFLNVFTPDASTASRRPVMVWLHGGGWWVGSGSAPTQDGSNLAKFGDVVVVTLNHRLSVFGHILLPDEGGRFADSGNAGVLDIVAALQWVRDNIAGFGGDPDNVTIFGVSGGAGKVAALMGTPAASGLFHKAIAQSCSGGIRILEEGEATAMADDLARNLGLDRATGPALQQFPYEDLVRAMLATSVRFRPVLDGRTFTRHPWDPDAPPISRHIPLMAGNTANETTIHLSRDMANFSLDAEEMRRRVMRYLSTDAPATDRILAAYTAAYPAYSPSEILNAITTDYQYHRNTRRLAELQAQAGQAPVYSFILEWRTPVMDGLLKAYHGMDIPFVFGTTGLSQDMLGDSPDVARLSNMVMASWAAFARNGDPNNPMMPPWPQFTPERGETMMLNLPSRVESDPGGEARAALGPLPWFEYSVPLSFIAPSDAPAPHGD